jgi:hypothetical protein
MLRAHFEIPVTDIKVSTMDELTDYKSFAAAAKEARDRKAKRREDKAKADKDYMANKRERVKKGIKFYDTKGKGYVKDGVKTYEETIAEISPANPTRIKPYNPYSVKNKLKMAIKSVAAGPVKEEGSGAAKPTYVSTDKKKVKKEEADGTPSSVEEEKKGLYANIHAKRKRGESPAKPGDEDYPAKNAFKKAAKTAKKEGYEYTDEGLVDGVKNIFNNLKNKMKQNSDARKKYNQTNPGGNITKDQYMQQIRNAGGNPSHQEGTSYGIYKGDGKPKGPMANFGDDKKKISLRHGRERQVRVSQVD